MSTRLLPEVKQVITSSYDPRGATAARAASKQFEADQKAAAVTAKTANGNILSSFLGMAQGADTHLGSLTASGGKAIKSLKDVENSGVSLASSLAMGVGLAAGTAGAALTAFAMKGVGDFVHLADETRSLELRMGGTAEQSSRLIEAGAALGVNSDTLTGSFFKLSKAIEGGEKNFAQYGITVAKTKAGGTDLHGTLLNVIDAFNATTDPAERDAIAFTAFGKSGSSLIPILAQGRAGLTELEAAAKNVMSQDDLNRAKDYELAQKRLEESNKRLAASLGRELVPGFTRVADLATAYTSGLDEVQKKSFEVNNTSAKLRDSLGIPFIGGLVATRQLGDAFVGLHDAEVKTTIASDNANATITQQTQLMKDTADAADKMYNAFMSGADADWALVKSNEAASKSINDTNKAQDALTALQVKGGATADQLASATDAVKSAQDNEASSAIATAKAAEAAAKAKAGQMNAVYGARDSINTEIASLQASEAHLTGPALAAVQAYIATLRAVPPDISTSVSVTIDPASRTLLQSLQSTRQAFTAGGRAGGGPVVPNRVYTVGERGPEQVVFGAAGHVYPTGQGPAPGPGGAPGGGGDMINNFYGDVRRDEGDRLGRDIAWRMKTGGG